MARQAAEQKSPRPPGGGRGPARDGRRTQAERSASTRERLLDATLDCLVELGWAHTTTTEVAQRAGVSRGAQLHHYPTRSELVGAAVAHLAGRRLAEFAEAVRRLPPGSDFVSAGIDLLWTIFSEPTAYALLELVVAARTDSELRASLAPVAEQLEARIAALSGELLGSGSGRDPRLRTLRNLSFALLHGLAVTSIVNDDPSARREVLEFLKQLSRAVLAGGGSPSRLPPEVT